MPTPSECPAREWSGHPRLAWLLALEEPRVALSWPLGEWGRVVRLSRRLRLLPRLANGLHAAGLIEQVPAEARRHLLAEQRLSAWRTSTLIWAVHRIGASLSGRGYPCVLLKGSAYVGQELPIAAGRLPSDLDILVPRAHLADAQECLLAAGWEEAALDEHDQRYYREWSHEVPPMRHPQHRIELDLHHNILPPVARTRVDADALLERLRPSKWPAWQVLDPVDQVLHCAAHLFLDADGRDRLRDLVDVDGLLRHFGVEPGFWARLPERAVALGLTEPLALALHFAMRWTATPVPPGIVDAVAVAGLPAWRRTGIRRLFEQVLLPTQPDDRSTLSQRLATTVLLLRYHRQRMPMRLLVPHLWHKLQADRQAAKEASVARRRGCATSNRARSRPAR